MNMGNDGWLSFRSPYPSQKMPLYFHEDGCNGRFMLYILTGLLPSQ